MNVKLLQYVPKYYKPYVADVKQGERVWNEHTKRWNTEIEVTWQVGDKEYTTIYQNAAHMYNTLKEFGNDFVDSNMNLITM